MVREDEKRMLGFYDYTVVLTYLSLMISVGGMFLSVNGHLHWAIFCLALSGLCDMFDGKVARTKKDRTDDEKRFGIQIDSLCDVVCFGAAPALLAYQMGMRSTVGIVILMFYVLAGLIRLAYYNVTEEHRQEETEECRKYYQGLPITSIAIILPLLKVCSPLFGKEFLLAVHVVMLVTGLLFITNFKLYKPKTVIMAVIVIFVGLAVCKVLCQSLLGRIL